MLSFYVCARNFLSERLVRNDRGATAVEYGLILAGVAAAIGLIVFTLGGKIETAFTTVSNDF
jgi:pilus assembly protein Flp/PilA